MNISNWYSLSSSEHAILLDTENWVDNYDILTWPFWEASSSSLWTIIAIQLDAFLYSAHFLLRKQFWPNTRCLTIKSFRKRLSYHFFWANQQNGDIKLFSWTQCEISEDRCDWHIMAGKDLINFSYNLNRIKCKKMLLITICVRKWEFDWIKSLIQRANNDQEFCYSTARRKNGTK